MADTQINTSSTEASSTRKDTNFFEKYGITTYWDKIYDGEDPQPFANINVFPVKEEEKTYGGYNEEKKDALNRPIPPPYAEGLIRNRSCYLYINTNGVALTKDDQGNVTAPLFVVELVKANQELKKYNQENHFTDDKLGIWEFLITRVNIQHREAHNSVNVLSDTIANISGGATPVIVNISGYILEDLLDDHVYNITYLFENFLRASKSIDSDSMQFKYDVVLYAFGVYYHLELCDILFQPEVNQGGYTPFSLASKAYKITIDETVLPKESSIGYLKKVSETQDTSATTLDAGNSYNNLVTA